MADTKLINGRIPPHTPCPYRNQCRDSSNGTCGHTGVEHSVAYSCGYARLFALMEKKDG